MGARLVPKRRCMCVSVVQGSKVCAKFLASKIFRDKNILLGLSGGAAGRQEPSNFFFAGPVAGWPGKIFFSHGRAAQGPSKIFFSRLAAQLGFLL